MLFLRTKIQKAVCLIFAHISLNLYEFIRNLTYFNIGETSQFCRDVYNEELHEFTCRLLFELFGIGIYGDAIYHHNDNQPKDDLLQCENLEIISLIM